MHASRLKESLDYVLGGPGDPRQPTVLVGDAERHADLKRQFRSRTPETHVALSYAEEDRPTRQMMRDDVEAFLREFAPVPPDALSYVAVIHREAVGIEVGDALEARKRRHRLAVHLLLLNSDLRSGRRIQPLYLAKDWRRLREWTRSRNKSQGYACPFDPARRRPAKLTEQETEARIAQLRAALAEAAKVLSPLTPEMVARVIERQMPRAKARLTSSGPTLRAVVRAPGIRGSIHLTMDRTHAHLEIERRARGPVADDGRDRPCGAHRDRLVKSPHENTPTQNQTRGAHLDRNRPTIGLNRSATENHQGLSVDAGSRATDGAVDRPTRRLLRDALGAALQVTPDMMRPARPSPAPAPSLMP